MDDAIQKILDFWFGPLHPSGLCAKERHTLWFSTNADTDAQCRKKFGDHLIQARAGRLNHWKETDDGLTALIVLLDQLSRNIHRGTPEAFSADPAALALALEAIAAGRDKTLAPIYRAFVYMPLEHSENLVLQAQCVSLFEALAMAVPDEQMASFARFARAHHDVIAKFGRFPHRNEILGRASTVQEIEHLKKHGGF